jgi:DNA-binding transcriptional ArsR family regulator
MDPTVLRSALIDGACARADLSEEDAMDAALGDPEAIAKATALPHVEYGFRSLLEAQGEETRHRIASMLDAANDILGPSISAVMPALRRDADEKGSLARSMKPQQLVESATNGVTFEMQAHMTGVLLVPSKIIRPWTVMTEHDGLQVFAYSVAEEHLNADPDAPPGYLVELYKALGDERRLKMLSFLSEGDRGLMEIAEHVDLAKSTTHHHLRILRSAGLVRVIVGGSKTYSLRSDRVPEAGRLLDAYLTTPADAAESAISSEPQRS